MKCCYPAGRARQRRFGASFLVSIFFFLVSAAPVFALDYYWVNGSGQWSDYQNHWAKNPTPTGPADFHANVPTADDDVFFTNNGGAAYTVNVNSGSTVPKCRNMDWSAAPAGTVWAGGGGAIDIYGSVVLDANMSMTFSGEVHFKGTTGTNTIFSDGVHFSTIVYFEGTGGGWQLLDDFFSETGIQHTGGLLETKGKTVSINNGNFHGGNNAGILHLETSTIKLLNSGMQIYYPPGQFDGSNAKIECYGSNHIDGAWYHSSLMTLKDVTFFHPTADVYFANGNITGKLTFHGPGAIYSNNIPGHIPVLNDVEFKQNGNLFNGNKYNHLKLTAGKTYIFGQYSDYNFYTDHTILPGGSFTALGSNSCSQFITIKSGQFGKHFNFINNSGATQTAHCTILEDCHAIGNTLEVLDGVNLGNNTGWVFTAPHVTPALYWVGGAGNWNDPNHWSTTDGGAPGLCLPNGATDVFFTANSGFSAGNEVIAFEDAYCHKMDWTGVTGVPKFILPNAKNLFIYDSLTLVSPAQMSWQNDGDLHFRGTDNLNVITTAGQILDQWSFFEGSGLYKFGDAFTTKKYVQHVNGEIRTMGFPVQILAWYGFWTGYDPPKHLGNPATTLWLGDPVLGTSSTLTLTDVWYPGVPPTFYNDYPAGQFHAMNSHIIVNGGGGNRIRNVYSTVTHDYWKVTFTSGTFEQGNILDKLTFTSLGNIDVSGHIHEVEFFENGRIRGNHSFDQITVRGSYFYQFFGGNVQTVTAGGSITVLNGSCSSLAYFYVDNPTETAKIAKASGSLALNHIIFDNVLPDLTTGATYSAANSFGIQPQVATDWNIVNAAPRNLFWVGGSGTWNDAAHWSLAPGGAGGECPPTPVDNVRFDAASGLGAGSVVDVTQRWAFCKDMDWTGVTGGAKFYTVLPPYTPNQMAVFGSLTFSMGMVNDFAGDFWMRAKTPATITSAGKQIKNSIHFWEPMGDWTLGDPFWVFNDVDHNFGKFRSNDFGITIERNWENTRALASTEVFFGNSLVTFKALVSEPCSATLYYAPGTFHAGTSSFVFENNKQGRIYAQGHEVELYNVTFKANNGVIWGASVANKLLFEQNGTIENGNGLTVKEVEFLGDAVLNDSRSYHSIKFAPGKRYTLTSGTTQTIAPMGLMEGQFIAQGLPGQYIELKSSNPAQQAVIHMDDLNGTSTCTKYLFLTGMAHTGTEDIYVPTPGGNVQNNAGWLFFPCSPCPATLPKLDVAASNTKPCINGTATLVLQNLKPDETAHWYDDPAATNLIYSGGNLFQPFASGTTTFYARTFSDGGQCTSTVILTVTVTPVAAPQIFNVTGGGVVCIGSNGALIGLDDSQTGVNYQLLRDGTATGNPIAGTGDVLFFPPQSDPGTYTVVATVAGSSCSAAMSGSAVVTGNPAQAPAIAASSNAPFCAGAANLLLHESGGAAIDWTWSGPNGFTSMLQNPVIVNPTPAASGTYAVVIYAGNGCTNSAVLTVHIFGESDIFGNISRPDCPTPIEGVTVSLTGGEAATDLTDASGNYLFENLNCGGSFTVTPTKDGDDAVGVTVLDLLKIRRGILGIEQLTIHETVRADVNGDGASNYGAPLQGVSTFDEVLTRKVILDVQDFPIPSWRFITTNHIFSGSNPITYDSLVSPLLADSPVDFYGYKTGDVVEECAPMGPPTVKFIADDANILLCGTTAVDVRVEDFADVAGFQFSMDWDEMKVEFVQIVPTGVLPDFAVNQAFVTAAGGLRVAWFNPNGSGMSLPDNTVIFTLFFKKAGSQATASTLEFTDSPTLRQVVNGSMEPHEMLQDEGVLTPLNNPPTVSSVDVVPVSCFSGSDGSINITVSGGAPPYGFAWAGPNGFTSNSEDINFLKAGVYTCTFTDASGCSGTSGPIVVPQPQPLNLNTNQITIQYASCGSTPDGSITLSPTAITGGTPSYQLFWSNGETSYTNPNLAPGQYSLTVTDANGCSMVPPTFTISSQNLPVDILGNISRPDCATPVADVSVQLHNFNTGNAQTDLTDPAGNYLFENLNCSGDYLVAPTKDGGDRDGVNVLDLLAMSRHILGIEPLGSPYKIIEGDVNISNTFTTFDIVETRKLILGIYDEFPATNSWRFVPKTHVFQHPNNPFQPSFPGNETFSPLLSDEVSDFYALKIGDVVGCNQAPGPATVKFIAQDKNITTCEDWVDVTVEDFTGVNGFQFSMAWDPSKIMFSQIDPSPGAALPGFNFNNFGLSQSSDGNLSVAWANQNPTPPGASLPNGTVLFRIQFHVMQGAPPMNSSLTFTDLPTQRLVVDGNLQTNEMLQDDGMITTGGCLAPGMVMVLAEDKTVSTCAPWVNVYVKDFTDVLSFQFSMDWDETMLQFLEVGDFNPALSGLGAGNFNVSQTASGTLTLAWADPNVVGVSLPDDAVIFKIKFQPIGVPAGMTALAFTDSPVPRELVKSTNPNQIQSILTHNGMLDYCLPPVALCHDVTVNLGPGECETPVTPALIDNGSMADCGPLTLVVSPTVAPIGTTVATLTASDFCSSSTCMATITVNENPSTNLPVCHDMLPIALPADCPFCIGAGLILEGGQYGCFDDYLVEMDRTIPLGNGPWESPCVDGNDVGQTFQIRVTDPSTGNSCWSAVTIFDVLPPALNCQNFQIPCNTPDLTPAYLNNVLGKPALPNITDCQSFTSVYTDTNIPQSCSSGLTNIIHRTWTATDASGNSATCLQIIEQVRSTLADVVVPPDFDGFAQPVFQCVNGVYPTPEWIQNQGYQGYPTIFGYPSGCEIYFVYEDLLINICDGEKRILRKWTIVDFCTGNTFNHNQRIKIVDTQGPTVLTPGFCGSTVEVGTDLFSCQANFDLPDVIVTDNCSRLSTVRAEWQVNGTDFFKNGHFSTFSGNDFSNPDTMAVLPVAENLPLGSTTITYIFTDNCGQSSSCVFTANVVDGQPPSVACEEFTAVAVGFGDVFVDAQTFDDGSYDNCGSVFFKVRRMDTNSCQSETEFHDQARFCCSDVGNSIYLMLRVYDVDPGAGDVSLSHLENRASDCLVEVVVQDKIKPTCIPPAHITVVCENFDPSLAAYGFATGTDNCCLNGVTVTNNYANFDTVCNRGTITRRFRAEDCAGLTSTCTQRIVVEYHQNYFVKMPDDVVATSCDGTGNWGEPTFFGEDCELFGISTEDDTIAVVPDACFKIIRNWTIINWCSYDSNKPCVTVPNPQPNSSPNHPDNLPGPIVSAPGTAAPWTATVAAILPGQQPTDFSTYWSENVNCYKYTQTIKVIDSQGPTLDNCPSSTVEICDYTTNTDHLWNEPYWVNQQANSNDLNEAPADLSITGTDLCTGPGGAVRYLLFLDLDNNGVMETVVNSQNLPPSNTVFFGNAFNPSYTGGTPRAFDERPVAANEKYRFALQTVISGNKKTATVRWNSDLNPNTYVVPELPYGTHKIKWFWEDACGNETTCEYLIVVPKADCTPPTVSCNACVNAELAQNQTVTLGVADFLQSASDDQTPSSQLLRAIRVAGTGSGFPTNPDGSPQTSLTFDCDDLGRRNIEVWVKDLGGNTATCASQLILTDPLHACGMPYQNLVFCPGETVPQQSIIPPFGQISGATYSWTNDQPTIGLPISGSGPIPAFVAQNECPNNLTATITVRASYGDCDQVTIGSFTITVNPGLVVFEVGDVVLCDGYWNNIIEFMGSFPNMDFSWTNDNPTIGLPASGTGDIPSFTAINTGQTPVVANIQVIGSGISGLACPNPIPENFTITVGPTPVMDTPSNQELCGGQYTSPVNFSSNIPSSFSWTCDNPAIGLPASGMGNIQSFQAVNQTGAPITATISVQPRNGDGQPPMLACEVGLSAGLNPFGMLFLYASDFLAYVSDNETPSNLIKIGIRKHGAGTGFPRDQNGNPITTVVFDCSEIGFQQVEIWAEDECGDADYCLSSIYINDNFNACNTMGNASVSGQVVTELGDGVEEVCVEITGPGVSRFTKTDANGNYSFSNLPDGQEYKIYLNKDVNHLNGVSTFDLVKISKHILGEELLDSPYKIIAADADLSMSVTSADLVMIRALILAIISELPANSWKFVPADFVFPNPANPFGAPFPMDCKTVTVNGSLSGQNFIGIKTGDVNNSVVANGRPADSGNRSSNFTHICGDCYGQPVTFTITVFPQPSLTATVTEPLCLGSDATFEAVGSGAVLWNWVGPNGFSNSDQNFQIADIQAFQTGNYVATVFGANGCTNFDEVTVSLQESPVISNCPSNIIVLNDLNACGANVSFVEPTASSPCFTTSISQTGGIASGGFFQVGTTIQTFAAVDDAGNTASCQFSVTVLDGQPPTAVCEDLTLEINTTGAISISDVDNGSSDNCPGTLSFELDRYGFDCSHLGQNTVTLTATDANSNSSTCTATVTVVDNLPPFFTHCPVNIAVGNDLDKCGAKIVFSDPIALDNCNFVSLAQTSGLPSGSFFQIGTTEQIFTATDGSGNTATCFFTITVMDMQLPTAVCKDYVLNLNTTGTGSITVNDLNGGSTDNCPAGLLFVLNKTTFNCSNVGENNVTLTVTDASGNSASCVGEVTVRDVTKPVITACPPGTSVADCDAAVPVFTGLTATDACGMAAGFLQNPVAGTDFGQLSGHLVVVTFTATDLNGNTATCTATVTINDNVKPTFDNCPASLSVGNDVDKCGANVSFLNPTASDNCFDVVVAPAAGNIPAGGFFPLGPTTQLFTATDGAGNTQTCHFTVTVSDVQKPTAVCKDFILNLNASGTGSIAAADLNGGSLDNCPGTLNFVLNKTTFNCSNVGENNVTLTVTDASGNSASCVGEVSVRDVTKPTFICPAPITVVGCDRLVPDVVSGITDEADACGVASTVQNPVAGLDFGQTSGNSILITVTVTDANGNAASCSVTLTIDDDDAPDFLNCPTATVMVGNDPDQCSAKMNWQPPAALDDCQPLANVVQIFGPLPGTVVPVTCPPTAQTVVYRATDAEGNTATCSFQVMAVDTEKPDFDADVVMPTNIKVECHAVPTNCVFHGNGLCSPLVQDDVNDNCTVPANLQISFLENSTQGNDPALCSFYDYNLTRTWTVTDCAGNARVHTQLIDVNDTTKPTAICKNAALILDKTGTAGLLADAVNNGSSDNCAAPLFLKFNVSPSSFTCANLGQNVVTLTVTDPCNNAGTCTAIVTVSEGIAPCTPQVFVKTTCLDNATTDANGQFSDLISVKSLAMQNWTLTANSTASGKGFFSASQTLLPTGTALKSGTTDQLDNDNDGQTDEADEMIWYTLAGVHTDCIGYDVTLSNGSQPQRIENKACYPTPVFENLNDPFCLNTPVFTIKIGEQNGAAGAPVPGSVMVDGVATTQFNAAALGLGSHTVMATFDAGTATTNLVVNGVQVGGSMADALADPGCKQKISKTVQIVATPNSLKCNDLLHVSLDEDCQTTIAADDVLEGTYFCFDDYLVEIDRIAPFGNGPWVSANLTASDIGKTFTYRVVHVTGGPNVCWGEVKIEDKLAPQLSCPTDVTIACSESTTTTAPTTDCSNFSVKILDDVVDNGECGSPRQIITRTFIATDVWENQSTCRQQITVVPFDLDDVVFPADVVVNCENVYLNPAATMPQNTGRPSIEGAPIGTGGLCSASIGFTDVRLEICAGSFEIYRTWLVANTCLPPSVTNPATRHQRIRVKDLGGPVFDCPPAVTVSTDPLTCCATAALPEIIVSEGCSVISGLEAKVTHVDPSSGNISTFTVNGQLVDFQGNNRWTPDTLAVFNNSNCLPLGEYSVEYRAADQCGNLSVCSFVLTVDDRVPPNAVCDEFTQVSIGVSGMVLVDAVTFDDGSKDACSSTSFKVRRMLPNPCQPVDSFFNQVKFCCSDIGDTVTVVMRVYDVEPDPGTVSLDHLADHAGECMVQVFVGDKLKPECKSPANVTVSCEAFDPSLWAYGTATAEDNCCLDSIFENRNLAQFDTLCNRGTIIRRFTAVDCFGLTGQCTQRVVVNYQQDYHVRFPNDRVVFECDGTTNFGEPVLNKKDCEVMAISFEDQVFTVVPDACFKIERLWTVINWCTYDPNEDCIYVPNPNPNALPNASANLQGPTVSPAGTPSPWAPTITALEPGGPQVNFSSFWAADANCYQYRQIIKVIDNEDPVIAANELEDCDLTPNDPQLWNDPGFWDPTHGLHDLCEAPVKISISAVDSCSVTNLKTRALVFLDLNNDGTMETVLNMNGSLAAPPGFIQVNNAANPSFSGGDLIPFDNRPVPPNLRYRFALREQIVGGFKKTSIAWTDQTNPNPANNSHWTLPQIPHGKHKIKWLADDNCGNETTWESPWDVRDCKAPTVVCLNGLSVNVMPSKMVVLWASDFLHYGEDNCTPASQLVYSIRKSGTGTGFPLDANGNPIPALTWTCNELGTQYVELWAKDAAGNASFCETYVIIQDPAGVVCSGSLVVASVAGDLKTEKTECLEDADVAINGSHPALPQIDMFDLSDDAGHFAFTDAVPLGGNYTLTPLKDDNPLNGVSTYDLFLISKHILGVEPLSSPFKMIAADANRSGTITTFDVVEIRKLILGIYDELPSNTSWRFVDKTHVFPDPLNPFSVPIPETKSIANLTDNRLDEGFVAVKVADVNQNAVANNLMAADDRTTGTLHFDVDAQHTGQSPARAAVRAGEIFEVKFTPAEQVIGYQFTLIFNDLEILEVLPHRAEPGASAENFAVFSNEKALTTSVFSDEKMAFSVRFKATADGNLSEMLGVSSRITRAEAYNLASEPLAVALRFNDGDGKATVSGLGFELYQNQPNPFVNRTSIGFHLPEATEATLTVFDETGRLLLTRKGHFEKGYHSVSLDQNSLEASGAMFYKLETEKDSGVRKMIRQE